MTVAPSHPSPEQELATARLRLESLDERVLRLIASEDATSLEVVPIERSAGELVVAVADPLEAADIRRLERQAATRIRQVRAPLNDVRAALALVHGEAPPPPAEALLGEWLVLLGTLQPNAVDAALRQAREDRLPLGQALLSTGEVNEDQLLDALSLRLSLPVVPLDRYPVARGVGALVDRAYAMEHRVLPFRGDGAFLLVATAEDTNPAAIKEIQRRTGYSVRRVLCRSDLLDVAIDRAFQDELVRSALKPLPEVLLDLGLVDERALELAYEVSVRSGDDPFGVLVRRARLGAGELRSAEARQYGLGVLARPPFMRPVFASVLPRALAERHGAVVVGVSDTAIELAVADPRDRSLECWLGYLTMKRVDVVLTEPLTIDRLQRQLYDNWSARASVEIEPISIQLQRDGLLTADQVAAIAEIGRTHEHSFLHAAAEHGALSAEDLEVAQALWLGLPMARLDRFRFDQTLLDAAGSAILLEHQMIPLVQLGGATVLAMADPLDAAGIRRVEAATSLVATPVLAPAAQIVAAIERSFVFDRTPETTRLVALGVRLVGHYLLSAVEWREAAARIENGAPLDRALQETTGRDPDQLAHDLAGAFDLLFADLEPRQISDRVVDALGLETDRLRWIDPVEPMAARRLSLETARARGMLPIAVEGSRLVVALADPSDEASRETAATELQPSEIEWVVATRTAIDDAINRTIGRKNLGTYLLEAGRITQAELSRAIDYQQRTGARLGQALVTLGTLRPEQLTEVLAMQNDLIAVDLSSMPPSPELVREIPEEIAREYGVIPVGVLPDTIIVAMVDPLDQTAADAVRRATGKRVERVLATEGAVSALLQDTYRDDYLRTSAMDLVIRSPEDSAIRVISRGQKVFFIGAIVVSLLLLLVVPIPFLIALNGTATLFYFSFSSYRFYLIFKALGYSLEVETSAEEVAALDERDLPIYTILIPLYREAAIAQRLVTAIDRLDYPKAKLDVKLLVEEDDAETLDGLLAADMPAHFKLVIVPHGMPKGKPKACNYGLIQAQGEYVVIFDAEDIPDPDQLKKVIVAFNKSEPTLACIQCKLNYYNRGQNLLTKWFTTEYSMWFDLFLPGLDAAGAPIPLGGTSNHFRTSQLKAVGAWDPWNVTEDADLGIRLYKEGLTTAIVDSTTYEEANSEVWNWIRQRSRWVKGYIQTWLVHMRNPYRLWRELGTVPFLSFNFVIGGTFFGFLMNPVYWLLTVLWFLTRAGFIQEIFPGVIFYMGAFALYVGNFAFAYINVAGCVRRKYYDMVKYAVISPIYWALMSIAAWKGFLQLFYKPFYWEKTVHGLYSGPLDTHGGQGGGG